MDDYFTLTKIQNQQLKARFSINTELITDLIDNYCSISEVIQKEEKTKTHIIFSFIFFKIYNLIIFLFFCNLNTLFLT